MQAGDQEDVLHLEVGGDALEPEGQRDLCPWRFSVLDWTKREPGLGNHTGPVSLFCFILVPCQERWVGLENLPEKSNGHDQKSRKCHLRGKTWNLLMIATHRPLSVTPGAEYGYDTQSGGRRRQRILALQSGGQQQTLACGLTELLRKTEVLRNLLALRGKE